MAEPGCRGYRKLTLTVRDEASVTVQVVAVTLSQPAQEATGALAEVSVTTVPKP